MVYSQMPRISIFTLLQHTQLINMLIELIKVKTEYYRGLARSHTAPLGASRATTINTQNESMGQSMPYKLVSHMSGRSGNLEVGAREHGAHLPRLFSNSCASSSMAVRRPTVTILYIKLSITMRDSLGLARPVAGWGL